MNPCFQRPIPARLVSASLVFAGGALLAACASTPTRFFTLDPTPAAGPVASGYAGPAVKVLSVSIPPALDREELVEETAPGEIKVHDFEHWAAPLGQTCRQILTQDLATRMPAGAVLGPATPGGARVATLSVDIVAFHANPQGSTLQAAWSAALPGAPGAAATPIVLHSALETLQGPAASVEGAGTAQALSALMGQLADQIASDLPERVQEAMARDRVRQAVMQAETPAARAHVVTRTTTKTTQRTAPPS